MLLEQLINFKKMKNIYIILLLSFAIFSCETPTQANSDYPVVIDETELVALQNSQYESMNSGDIESVMDLYSDTAMWSFPNGVNMEGKDQIKSMLETTTGIWNISSGEDTNYIAMKGKDTNEDGEEFDFHILLSWGPQTFSNDDTSITVPYHSATFFVGEDKKIQWTGAFYDRTKFVEAYDEDPIK